MLSLEKDFDKILPPLPQQEGSSRRQPIHDESIQSLSHVDVRN